MLSVLFTSFPCLSASAATEAVPPELVEFRALTKQIILKEVQLERFNLSLWLLLNKHTRAEDWRFYLARQANDACDLTEYLVGTCERTRVLHHPEELSRTTIRRGRTAGLVGDCIGATAPMFELSVNAMQYRRRQRSALSSQRCFETVKDLKSDVTALLDRRLALVQAAHGYSKAELDIAWQEGEVLRGILNVLCNEYVDVVSGARRNAARENTFYALNSTTGWLGVVEAIIATKAVDRETLSGPAQLWTVIQGAFIVGTPYVSTLVSRLAGRHKRKTLREQLDVDPTYTSDRLNKQMNDLNQMMLAQQYNAGVKDHPIWNRFALEKEGVGHFLSSIAVEQRRLRELNKVAFEKEKEATIVGGAQIASGIIGLVANYGINKEREVRINAVERASDITALAGYGFSVANNLKSQIHGQLEWSKLHREGRHPFQLVEQRLDSLRKYQEKLEKL